MTAIRKRFHIMQDILHRHRSNPTQDLLNLSKMKISIQASKWIIMHWKIICTIRKTVWNIIQEFKLKIKILQHSSARDPSRSNKSSKLYEGKTQNGTTRAIRFSSNTKWPRIVSKIYQRFFDVKSEQKSVCSIYFVSCNLLIPVMRGIFWMDT